MTIVLQDLGSRGSGRGQGWKEGKGLVTGVPQAVFIISLPDTTRASPKSATLMVALSLGSE